MTAPIGSERAAVQNPLLRYAIEAGWQYLSPDECLRLRGGEDSPLLRDLFRASVQALNPGVVDHLKADDLAYSRAVLRQFGNMSSATVMFVLNAMMRSANPGARGCAMAFGPGLIAETMLFHMAGSGSANEAREAFHQPVVRSPALSDG